MVEKLLRSTNVRKLYLLIRPKKGVETGGRLQALLQSSVFDTLKKLDASLLDKVEAINGDITEENLGIDDVSRQKLIDDVHIVFHSAATVRFDEELKKSVAMNIEAVASIIELAKEMKRLESVIDVSTAFCNCDLKHIDERIYDAPMDPRAIIDLCKVLDADKLNQPEVTKAIIGNKPNTYTFTKSLAENILQSEGKNLPIGIIRPSIVAATWKDPVPGERAIAI